MPHIGDGRYLVRCGWDDVPHLGTREKDELLAGTPPHLRDARSKGTPSLGAGAVYPVEESLITVAPFAVPDHWPRAYGLDVGWNRTAAIWGAWDREAACLYLTTEHYRAEALPAVHAAAIRARGAWIPGAVDPAARGRNTHDGRALMQDYLDLGLRLRPAANAVEAGILRLLDLLQTGRLKVFSTCRNWLAEWRLYRRDEQGRIVKAHDHLMDATRYLIMEYQTIAKTRPAPTPETAPGHIAPPTGDARAGD